jgi:hypothetical protein
MLHGSTTSDPEILMKKTASRTAPIRKLELDTVTVRRLQSADLVDVQGGNIKSMMSCCPSVLQGCGTTK